MTKRLLNPNLAIVAALGVIFSAAGVIAIDFPWLARIYPLTVCALGALLCVVELARIWCARSRSIGEDGVEIATGEGNDNVLFLRFKYIGWGAGYLAMIWILGFLPASWVFVALFLSFEGEVPPIKAVLAATVGLAVLLVLFHVMSIRTPSGVFSPEIQALCRSVTQELSRYVC